MVARGIHQRAKDPNFPLISTSINHLLLGGTFSKSRTELNYRIWFSQWLYKFTTNSLVAIYAKSAAMASPLVFGSHHKINKVALSGIFGYFSLFFGSLSAEIEYTAWLNRVGAGRKRT